MVHYPSASERFEYVEILNCLTVFWNYQWFISGCEFSGFSQFCWENLVCSWNRQWHLVFFHVEDLKPRRSGHICLLAETGKQSYFKQFSHLHSCVHPPWIQDHKSSWTIPLYLCKWHCAYCSCGYSEHTHQCLQWNLLNDMCHQYCRERMKKFTFI